MKNHEASYQTIDRLTKRLEELEKENKELKEGLFEKFSECYEVNKWTPESGFDSQLDFYIHESWKREPVVDKLRKQVENLECCGNCRLDRTPDCPKKDEWTVGCERCDNWQSDNMTKEERK